MKKKRNLSVPPPPQLLETGEEANFLARKPWLLIVAAFIILILAWAALIKTAYDNEPEQIMIELDLGE